MARKRSKILSQETKLLVLEFKQLFKSILKNIPNHARPEQFSHWIQSCSKITSIYKLKAALIQIPILQQILASKISNGGIVEYLYHQSTSFLNFARILKYLNKMMNGIADPSIICEGLWKKKQQIVQQKKNQNEEEMDTGTNQREFLNPFNESEAGDIPFYIFGDEIEGLEKPKEQDQVELVDQTIMQHKAQKEKSKDQPTGDGKNSKNAV